MLTNYDFRSLFAHRLIYGVLIADDIDLLNVSFEGETAPDRITARAGLKELKRIAPLRGYSNLNVHIVLLV